MHLRTLVILAATAYTLIIGGSLLLYRIFVVFPSLEASILERHQNDLRAVYATYINERENLILFNQDWSKWDDTYQFVNGSNPSFLNKSLHSPFFYRADVDAVAVIDTKGDTFYAAYKRDNDLVQVDNLKDITADINIEQIKNEEQLFGIIRSGDKLGYFSSHHIQDSLEQSKEIGALIFIRYFKKDFIKRIELLTNISAKLSLASRDVSSDLITLSSLNIKTIKQEYFLEIPNSAQQTIATIKIAYPDNSLPKVLNKSTLLSILYLLFLPIIITILVYAFFLIPITKIATQILAMNKAGKFHYLKLKSPIIEINTFINAFNTFSAKITAYQEKLKADSNTDGLTNIHNRRFFDDAYEKAWALSSRNQTPLCIVMLDIDHFKQYNDHYGHQQGDEALKQVAQALRENLRRSSDVLARYGGEEFAIVLQAEKADELESTLLMLVSCIDKLNIEHLYSSIKNNLTISCGACHVIDPALWMKDKKDDALKLADEALYRAKSQGRNQHQMASLKNTIGNKK